LSILIAASKTDFYLFGKTAYSKTYTYTNLIPNAPPTI